MTRISNCGVCGSKALKPVLDLGLHPMCDDLVEVGDDRVCEEYHIDIVYCSECNTAHQRYQIPKHELFPHSYHYRSRHTADVLNGMRNLVEACEETCKSLVKLKVLDIGCNDGSLLSIFKEHGAITYGVEPTGAAEDAVARNEHVIIKDFFSDEVAEAFLVQHGKPDIITFTNVFAHIEDLQGLIKALKVISGPKVLIVIENHYLGSVVERNQFDTFYHEHPRTYSYTSFTYIAEQLGMKVSTVTFPKRYGGNIRVFISPGEIDSNASELEALRQKELSYGTELEKLALLIEKWHAAKFAEISGVVAHHGKISGKAFPGRSAISIKLLNLNENHISAIYEKPGSGKIGCYVPGTRIPIKSDEEFNKDESVVFNLAWHISDEITSYLRSRGFTGKIIDIIAEDDFK